MGIRTDTPELSTWSQTSASGRAVKSLEGASGVIGYGRAEYPSKGFLNPRHPDFKAPAPNPFSSSGIEIIDVEDSPVSMPPPPPAKRRGTKSTQSMQVPNMPDFKLGYAEKERQVANQPRPDLLAPSRWSIFQLSLRISTGMNLRPRRAIGLLRPIGGRWTKATAIYISSQVLDSILKEIRLRNRRDNLKKWRHPDGFRDWTLGYTNPAKSTPRDIVTLTSGFSRKRLMLGRTIKG